MGNRCSNCEYEFLDAVAEPCSDRCFGTMEHRHFKPKENDNTNLTEKDKIMSTRTQEIYTGIVTESEKIKDDNGQIESIKKRVIYSTTELPAYDEDNAKIKIILAASKVKGEKAIKDVDEVEVKVSRPFQAS